MMSSASMTPRRRASAVLPLVLLAAFAGALVLFVWRLTTPPDVVLLPPALSAAMVRCEVPGAGDAPSRVFFADRFEVTEAAYARFVSATGRKAPRHWKGGAPSPDAASFPMTRVTWDDASAYAAWAGKRLPSAVEWSAVAGMGNASWPWGDLFSTACANTFELGLGRPSVVGTFESGKSATGAYDLSGNVAEWTSTSALSDLDARMVVCGGSFLDVAAGARVSADAIGGRTEGRRSESSDLGFRCVADADAVDRDEALRRALSSLGIRDPFGLLTEVIPARAVLSSGGEAARRLVASASALRQTPRVAEELRRLAEVSR